MAVDQALLESANELECITLRFYFWERPTISLGYFQPIESRNKHRASRGCDLVRRATGGGAIVHDRELTYSLCVPASNRWAADNQVIYNEIHRVIIGVLAGEGADGRLCPQARKTDPEPFLCFQRRAEGDILMGEDKIGGSAQRRVKNALLQHGSLLVAKSDSAPELPGINEIAGLRLDRKSLIEPCADAIAGRLGLELELGKLSESEIELAASVEKRQFGNAVWNGRR